MAHSKIPVSPGKVVIIKSSLTRNSSANGPSSQSSSATPHHFDNAQRTKHQQLSWGLWCFKHFLLLTLKCCVAYIFYTFHQYSTTGTSPHRSGHNNNNPMMGHGSPVLQSHLQEFLQASRMSKHELALQNALRSRKLAEHGGPLGGYDDDEDGSGGFRTAEYLWSPLENPQCARSGGGDDSNADEIPDPFPDSFDAVYYQAEASQSSSQEADGEGEQQQEEEEVEFDYEHWLHYGRANGWPCSRGQFILRDRDQFLQEIAHVVSGDWLEIGPFLQPWLKASEYWGSVDYFDVADYATLHAAAVSLNLQTAAAEESDIDYVHPQGDLEAVFGNPQSYNLVVSSHVLGIVRDVVRHLQQVGNLLREGGYYTMLVPDKRFSHDHFSTESTIADVLEVYFTTTDEEAFAPQNNKPTLRSLIESQALQVPNDADETWHGEYGFPYEDASDPQFLQKLRAAIGEFESYSSTSDDKDKSNNDQQLPFVVNTLSFQFTPQGLAFIVDTLHTLGITDLRVHRLYETVKNSDEFGIVLKKCTPV